MAEVGTYYITVMPEMSKFTSGVSSALGNLGTDSGKTFNGSFIDIVKGSAIGTALGGLAGNLGNLFMGGISTGIQRLDTLNNFPRVMESFGYSAGEADSAIELIMEHLRGLPTASQDVVQLTQAISDSTGDLDLASRAALGFNDMMLAAGASTSDMQVASSVLNRVLGKGSATVMQWQSLMGVMPKQLDLVAESMLGTEASSMDLYEALNNGEVSWNDFLAAIVKLDEEGTGAIGSFYDQAKANSVGIGSAISNIQNRIGAGWANVLDAIGQKNIHDALEGLADAFKAPLDEIATKVRWLKYTILGTKIDESIKKIGDAIGDTFGGIMQEASPYIRDFADALIGLVDGALSWLADHGEVVTAAIWGIVGALAMLAGFKLGTEIAMIPTALGAIVTAMAANPFLLIVAGIGLVVGALVGFFTQTETGKAIIEGFVEGCKQLWQDLKDEWTRTVEQIKQNLEDNMVQWEQFKTNISNCVENIKKTVTDKWKALCDSVKRYIADAKSNVIQNWQRWTSELSDLNERIKQGAIDKWNALKDAIKRYVEDAKNNVVQNWQRWCDELSQWNESIRQSISDKWNAIKQAIASKMMEIALTLYTKWWNAVYTVREALDNIRQNVSDKWNAIKQNISDRVSAIKTGISDGFRAAKDAALGVFDSLRSGIRDKIQSAYDTVSGIVSNIKGLFNFSWSLPRPSLPHISWHMESVAGLLSIPVFDGISWWAQGGIFERASIIGVGEGRDSEAVLPLNAKTYGAIARGIASEMGGSGVTVTGNTFVIREDADIERIAEALARRTRRDRMVMA